MATEGGWDPPPPPRDELLEELKWTAPAREWQAQAERRSLRTWLLRSCLGVVVLGAVAGVIGIVHQFHPGSLQLPARVGDLTHITSSALTNYMTGQLKTLEQDQRITQATGGFYGNDPGHPQVMVILLRAHHSDQDVTDLRAAMEAPLLGGEPSTPDGPHIVSATVNGVDFVCEPVIENGSNGPVGERTDCTWDDHGEGIGVVVDFFSGESSTVLREVEVVQPGAIS